MPSPLFLARPSGLYVRFFVPADLRGAVGSRFLVWPLHAPAGDGARLVAACMAVALSEAFGALRQGATVDLKKALEAARAAGRRDLTLERERLPDGTVRERWKMDTEEDIRLYRQARAGDDLESIGDNFAKERATIAREDAEAAKVREQGPLLSEAIATHLGDLERAKLDAKTIMDSRHSLRLLLGVVGDMPAGQLNAKHARAFLDAVRHWPRYATSRREYRDLKVAEVLALSKAKGEPEPAGHTLKKHRQRLSVFIQCLLAEGVLTRNPLNGVPKANEDAIDAEVETGRPFTPEELRAIFNPVNYLPWAAKYPHRFWGPILGLYSGARVNEVAQLYVEDIGTEDGVPGFHIRRSHEGQKIKGQKSRRFVPLAQPVLSAGFLGYVEEVRAAGHERLFPNLPNSTGLGFGRQLSRQFSAYIKGVGVDEAGLAFHGFRHTLATALDEAGEGLEDIARLTGHMDGREKVSVLDKFYIDRKTLPLRVATLAKFAVPVVLPPYTPGQFASALKAAPKKFKTAERKRTKK